jgi:hypothetical protein
MVTKYHFFVYFQSSIQYVLQSRRWLSKTSRYVVGVTCPSPYQNIINVHCQNLVGTSPHVPLRAGSPVLYILILRNSHCQWIKQKTSWLFFENLRHKLIQSISAFFYVSVKYFFTPLFQLFFTHLTSLHNINWCPKFATQNKWPFYDHF